MKKKYDYKVTQELTHNQVPAKFDVETQELIIDLPNTKKSRRIS